MNKTEYLKQYRIDNKEKIKEKNKQYQLDNPKIYIIAKWKHRGVIDDDINGFYDYFITQTNCWICDKVYNKDITMDRRCLDHDHDIKNDNNIRYICCNYCNINIVK
tara:strand:+ start:80 stop:397 length:318 start_codon:yes stop_codon:yes gene_type:complete